MTPTPSRPQAGFSLVELMIGVVIAMLALAFALRLVASSERSRETELGGSDSMQSGMVALFSMSNDASQAGFGLNDPIVAGCNTKIPATGTFALAPATRGGAPVTPLAPVVIESNGTAPDRISFYSGSALSGTASLVLDANYTGGSEIVVKRKPSGFAQGDVIVVAPDKPGGDCVLAQISSNPKDLPPVLPGNQKLLIEQKTEYPFNSGALGVNFDAGASRVFNLGHPQALSFHTWSVANGFLKLRSTNLSGGSQADTTFSDNVVSIKAQYGFDTRVGKASFLPEKGMQVNKWSSTILDADGDGVVGSAGDYQHIAAVRLAVVARSKVVERPGGVSGTACTATTDMPKIFADKVPQTVEAAVPVTVNLDGDPDWRCYRYRVFETVVNLRNNGWRPDA